MYVNTFIQIHQQQVNYGSFQICIKLCSYVVYILYIVFMYSWWVTIRFITLKTIAS